MLSSLRLQSVVILNLDFREVLKSYNKEHVFVYTDCSYLGTEYYYDHARELMADRATAESLYKTEPNLTWEEIVRKIPSFLMSKIKLRKENQIMIYGYTRVSTKGQSKVENSLECA